MCRGSTYIVNMNSHMRFAYLEDAPVIFDNDEAWWFIGGAWKRLHLADAMCKAKLLTEAEFSSMFRDDHLPNLPEVAFR